MNISKHTILAFIQGKQSAIEKVYVEYKNLMYFIIANYVDNQDDCDDVLSEAFMKAIERKESIKDPSKLKAYLSAIARNEAISFQRKKKDVASFETIETMYGEEDRTNTMLNMIEPLLSNKETIIVYYRTGFSYSWQELEEETGIPESTARRVYSKAMEKLRKELV